ncbi:MAG: LysM peptidoglycan-binding domain-containing M23 family metallopeptidase [Anaerolineae bacterium]
MDLYVGPRRKRPGRALLLLAVNLLLIGLLTWQQGWWPNQALAKWSQEVLDRAPAPLPQVQALVQPPAPAEPVIVVSSTVITHPQSQAYTADLYNPNAADGVIPWPNVAGRTKVLTYVVQEGDTLWSIAVQFGLDLATLRWSNPALESNPDLLAVGTELIILPVHGAYRLVSEGDTIESLAAQYHVAETDITSYPPNGLYPPYDLKIGRGVIIPYGRKDANLSHPLVTTGTSLAWPLVGKVARGFEPGHSAMDISAPAGSLVFAAEAGTVSFADLGGDSLGYTVFIRHANGLETRYLHLKGALVLPDETISRGQAIGEIGDADSATGPQVNFEVYLEGQLVNPTAYLPVGEPH